MVVCSYDSDSMPGKQCFLFILMQYAVLLTPKHLCVSLALGTYKYRKTCTWDNEIGHCVFLKGK